MASIVTLVIWTLYFHILLSSYHHRLRPRILINRSAGRSVNARCVVTNMSAEAIYVEAVIVSLTACRDSAKQTTIVCSLGDLDSTTPDGKDPRPHWFQGPLNSGEMIDVGSYQDLMERAMAARGQDTSGTERVTHLITTVVASYTAQDKLIAAERAFDIEQSAARKLLKPKSFSARQIRSWWDRRRLERLVVRELQPRARTCAGQRARR